MPADLFAGGDPQGIAQVLAGRDQRQAMQRALLERWAADPSRCLIVVNLNIPGPIKNSAALRELFCRGVKRLLADVPEALVEATWDRPVGNTLFASVPVPAQAMKRRTVRFEQRDPLGRLFDVDVIRALDASAVSRAELGLPPRRCLLCERPAKVCARSRRHTIQELHEAIRRICDAEAREDGHGASRS